MASHAHKQLIERLCCNKKAQLHLLYKGVRGISHWGCDTLLRLTGCKLTGATSLCVPMSGRTCTILEMLLLHCVYGASRTELGNVDSSNGMERESEPTALCLTSSLQTSASDLCCTQESKDSSLVSVSPDRLV